MYDISDKQIKILKFIDVHYTVYGYPPSVREIQSTLEMSSTSVVSYHINGLVDYGFLQREDGKARTLIITGVGHKYLQELLQKE